VVDGGDVASSGRGGDVVGWLGDCGDVAVDGGDVASSGGGGDVVGWLGGHRGRSWWRGDVVVVVGGR